MQSRFASLVEAIANVVLGYAAATLTQILVFPLFGIVISLAQNMILGVIFTAVSLARSYLLRRAFENYRLRLQRQSAAEQ